MKARPIVVDTDLNEDYDDAGALAVLHALADRGRVDLLGVSYATSSRFGPPVIQAINRCYGRPGLPIGTWKPSGFLDQYDTLGFLPFVARAFPSPLTKESAEESVSFLRRVLAARKSTEVTIVGLGPLVNLAALLASGPDAWSPLDGIDLIRCSVRHLVLMAGALPGGEEYNLVQAPEASRSVVEGWPGDLVFCDFHLGRSVQTGAGLHQGPWTANPVAAAYRLHAGTGPTASYDLLAAHFAGTQSRTVWQLSDRGTLVVDAKGHNEWMATPRGRGRDRRTVDPPPLTDGGYTGGAVPAGRRRGTGGPAESRTGSALEDGGGCKLGRVDGGRRGEPYR